MASEMRSSLNPVALGMDEVAPYSTKTWMSVLPTVRITWRSLAVAFQYSLVGWRDARQGREVKTAVPPALPLRLCCPSMRVDWDVTGLDRKQWWPNCFMVRVVEIWVSTVAEVSARAMKLQPWASMRAWNSLFLSRTLVGFTMANVARVTGFRLRCAGPGFLASPTLLPSKKFQFRKLHQGRWIRKAHQRSRTWGLP